MKKRTWMILIFVILVGCICGNGCVLPQAPGRTQAPNAENPKDAEATLPPKTVAGDVELENYWIKTVGNRQYLVFKDSANPGDSLGTAVGKGVSFSSFDQLMQAILEDRFTETQRKSISLFPRDENGVRLFDLNQPPQPHFPSDCSVKEVYWVGESVTFFLTDEKGTAIDMNELSNSEFSELYRTKYTDLLENQKIEVISTETVDNTDVILYETNVTAAKCVRKTVDGTVIQMIYNAKTRDSALPAPEEIPEKIQIFRDCGDYGIYVSMVKPTHAFSFEDCMQFTF